MSQLSLFNFNLFPTAKKGSDKTSPEKAIAQGLKFEYLDYPVHVIRRPYQRTLTISVRPSGTIRVTANRTTRPKSIMRFLEECRPWLKKVLDDYETLRAKYPPKKFRQGEKFLFLGERKKLRYVCMPCKRWQFDLQNDDLVCRVPREEWHYMIGVDEQPQLKEALLKFYEKKGRQVLKERIEIFSKQMGLYPSAVSFRSQKTRWGSCSSRGRISLNWRLIAAPLEALDYVVIHELAHLRHQNHSKNFWNLVAAHSANYAYWRKWLRDHQYEFDFLAKRSELHEPHI